MYVRWIILSPANGRVHLLFQRGRGRAVTIVVRACSLTPLLIQNAIKYYSLRYCFRGVWFSLYNHIVLFVLCNSVDPDQTLHVAASGLGLPCLPKSHLWNAMHLRVNSLFSNKK